MTTTAGQLDRDVQGLHDRYWQDQKIAAGKKSVVLVEGDDDCEVLEAFLRQRSPTFATRVRVVPAGGRARVLARLKNTFAVGAHPNAYGLVDRDTWTDADVVAEKTAEPRLFVTEGWCIENVFFAPDALRCCNPGVAAIVAAERERWVRAGALWWTLQRTREAQQCWQEALDWSYGAVRDDLDLGSASALAKSLRQKIPEHVRLGAELDVGVIAAEFERRCGEILAASDAQQWQTGVHGKAAFVHLLAAAQGRSPRELRRYLAELIARPPPIDQLIAMLLP